MPKTSEPAALRDVLEESSDHLTARVSLRVMAKTINERLRDNDDPNDVRDVLRRLLGHITRLQREFGYGERR